MTHNLIFACIGYALEQCYSSGIAVLDDIRCDEDHLQMLKSLADAYREAHRYASVNPWSISECILERIINASTIEEVYVDITNYEHFWCDDNVHATKMSYSNNKYRYIFIIPGDMIFVTDFDYTELQKRTEAGDIDSYEAYDLSDGCSYYLSSKYAEEISDALLHMIATCIPKQ